MFRFAIVGTLLAVATPAIAAERAHAPHQISDALKAGCKIQVVHTPAGKTVHQPAIVHCKRTTPIEIASTKPARAASQSTE